MADRLTAVGAIRRVTPPWLRRTHGARVMEGIADVLDSYVDRLVQGTKLRFPGAPPRAPDPDALALTGRERRIRRGPGETTTTYARRLPSWWDAHRGRGGPYAMLEQLHAYFLDWLNVRIDVTAHSGTRHWISPAGVITRDWISWSAGGPAEGWAHLWVVFYLPDEIPGAGLTLTTSEGVPLITDDGDELVVTPAISPADVTEADKEIFRAIPREWSAAHIPYVTIVLLFGGNRLWGYPVPTWGDWGVWQSVDPVVFTAE